MSATTAIARSEFTLTLRNKAVATTAIFLPLAIGGLIAWTVEPDASAASIVAVSIALAMFGLSTYATATTTLAARRKELFLKRLRSSTASNASILSGLLLPSALISIVQITVIYAFLSYSSGTTPQSPFILVPAILITTALCSGAALLTSAFTKSAEQAQVTTLPFLFAIIGAGSWAALPVNEDLAWVKRILPGGSTGEIVAASWEGTTWADMAPAFGILIAWAAAAVIVGVKMFRWEPRD